MSVALLNWLLADTAITDAAGGVFLDQVAPAGTADPYIRLTTVDAIPEQLHDGTDLGEDEDYTRVQIDIWGADSTAVTALRRLVRARVMQVGSIPDAAPRQAYDDTTGRFRASLDVQFYPVDVP